MKALILNGAKASDSIANNAQDILVRQLEQQGYECDTVLAAKLNVGYCLGCFKCWLKTPGICIQNDDGVDIARREVRSDLVVFLTPIVFGCCSPELKVVLERLIPNISPFFSRIDGEIHHKPRYSKFPNIIAIGINDHGKQKAEKIFRDLTGRNAKNFQSPVFVTGVLERDKPETFEKNINDFIAEAKVSQ